MTTLNRDQIAALRKDWVSDSLVLDDDFAILCDMATRLLDLCEAEPGGWLIDASDQVNWLFCRSAEVALHEADDDPSRITVLIPRPESKP